MLVVDLDGTLVNFARRHYESFMLATGVDRHASGCLTIENYWQCKRQGQSASDIWRNLQGKDLPADFWSKWHSLIESDVMLALDTLQPFAVDFLERYSRPPHGVVLATYRSNREGLMAQLKRLGIADFLCQVIACDRKLGKAASIADAQFNVSCTSGLLFVGDSEDDYAAAKSLGVQVVLVATGIRSAEFLRSIGAGTIVENLKEISIGQ